MLNLLNLNAGIHISMFFIILSSDEFWEFPAIFMEEINANRS